MESTQDGKLIEKLESICFSNISGNEIQLNFESLPPELILNIFEYMPEAICELRLTSQALKSLVDDFVHQRPTNPLVQKIRFNDYYHRYDEVERSPKENDPGTMRIWLEVPVRTAPLFEFRAKSCGINGKDNMGKHAKEDRGPLGYVNRYCIFNCDIPLANELNTSEWERLAECIGSSIEHVDISIREKTELAQMCSLLDQFQIVKLEIDIERFSENEKNVLLETVQHHKLEWLSLRISTLATTMLAAEFLLELSTHLRTLYIRGNYAVDNIEWVPLIIGMLTRKLDTLDINHWQRELLSREDADRLIVKLARFHALINQKKDRALTIIHKSRLIEDLPRGY